MFSDEAIRWSVLSLEFGYVGRDRFPNDFLVYRVVPVDEPIAHLDDLVAPFDLIE